MIRNFLDLGHPEHQPIEGFGGFNMLKKPHQNILVTWMNHPSPVAEPTNRMKEKMVVKVTGKKKNRDNVGFPTVAEYVFRDFPRACGEKWWFPRRFSLRFHRFPLGLRHPSVATFLGGLGRLGFSCRLGSFLLGQLVVGAHCKKNIWKPHENIWKCSSCRVIDLKINQHLGWFQSLSEILTVFFLDTATLELV